MAYRIAPDITFCLVDEHPVFLDVQADRYFTLPPESMQAFIAKRPAGLATEEIQIQSATCSALELSAPGHPDGTSALLEVAVLTLFVSFQLKRCGLKHTLELLPHRQAHPDLPSNSNAPIDEEARLLRACALFRRARQQVPIPTRCLLDSISLLRFLARRGLRGDLVFGVTKNPFTAHCWVQCGNMVMNDTLGNTQAYTPIRVV